MNVQFMSYYGLQMIPLYLSLAMWMFNLWVFLVCNCLLEGIREAGASWLLLWEVEIM